MPFGHKTYTLNLKGRLLMVDKPLVMGILNITPDSFHAASRMNDQDELLARAEAMLRDGADILDIGGQSTRPGATRISSDIEKSRVIPAIEVISKKFPEAILSIDTFYSDVAAESVKTGASLVNDISGGTIDTEMFNVVATLKVPYVLTHILGEPQTMQQNPQYENVTGDVISYFSKKINELNAAGVHDIILDPGFGFGKTIEHNLSLLHHLSEIQLFGFPILVGLSRKKTIQQLLSVDAQNALNGTTVMNTIALMKGASMIRVHDVHEAVEAVKLVTAVHGS